MRTFRPDTLAAMSDKPTPRPGASLEVTGKRKGPPFTVVITGVPSVDASDDVYLRVDALNNDELRNVCADVSALLSELVAGMDRSREANAERTEPPIPSLYVAN